MDKNTETQEMNIFQVMGRIGRSIGNFCMSIVGLMGAIARLAYKYKYLFLVCVAAIIALCVYQRRDAAKQYCADMHLLINDGDLFTYENLLHQLSEYPLREDVEGLAEAMNTSPEVASKIYGFESFHVIDLNRDTIMDFVDYEEKVAYGDTSKMIVPTQIVVRAKLNDLSYCAEVQKALIAYFSANDYLSSLNISRLSSLEEREWMFHNALLNLDSLQKVEYFKSVPSYAAEFASEKERSKPFVTAKRQMYYEDMKKLFDINEEIAVDMSTNLEVVTVVSPMQPEKKLKNPTWKIILINTLLGIFAFALIAYGWDRRKKLMDYLKQE